MATHRAPSDLSPAVAPANIPSIRASLGHKIAFRGFNEGGARAYIMGKAGQIKVVDGDTFVFACSTEETAVRFARACEALGGEVWETSYRGKGRGFKVDAIMGGAWAKYLAS